MVILGPVRAFYLEFTSTSRAFEYTGFLPQSKTMNIGSIGESLCVRVCVCEVVSVSTHSSPLTMLTNRQFIKKNAYVSVSLVI